MKLEIDAHEDQGTWDVTTLPPGKTVIACQWIYKEKYNADGTIQRHKSRLVACGNKQVEGEDFDETFAPVVKMATVRGLLRIAAAKNWEVHQMDVHNAFLHGDLQEEVYMRMPPDFSHLDPSKVCRLRKAIYGLRQVPRCWFTKLSLALEKFGFVQSYSDYSLFTYSQGKVEVRVLVYVDDLVIASNFINLLVLERDSFYINESMCWTLWQTLVFLVLNLRALLLNKITSFTLRTRFFFLIRKCIVILLVDWYISL